MTRNEALNECKKICNDSTLDETEKTNKIVDFIMEKEVAHSEKDVRAFIRQLEESTGINLTSAKIWNMIREKQ